MLKNTRHTNSKTAIPQDVRIYRGTINLFTQAIFDNIPIAIIAFNQKGTIIARNKFYNQFTLNYNINEVQDIFTHPIIKENHLTQKIQTLLQGKPFETVIPKCTLHKRIVTLHLLGIPLPPGTGGMLLIENYNEQSSKTSQLEPLKPFEFFKHLSQSPAGSVRLEPQSKSDNDLPKKVDATFKLNTIEQLIQEFTNELNWGLTTIRNSIRILALETTLKTSDGFGQIDDTIPISRNPFISKEPAGNGKLRRHLTIIQQELDAANQLLKNLNQFINITLPERMKVAVREIVDDALSGLSLPPTIKVIFDFPKILPCLYVDRYQIRIAIERILTHSIYSMLTGGKLIFSARHDDFNSFLILTISDTGIGISRFPSNLGPNPIRVPKVLRPIFLPKMRDIQLGLIIARYLIAINKGEIEHKVIPGIGTTWTLKLPAESIG
ncbi:MAG: hypothetical protein ABIK93_03395 [candidate division WOR-3 bacterium]